MAACRGARKRGNALKERVRGFWLEWRWFFLFIAVMLPFRSTIADWNQVPSGSMQPSILAGDRIVVDKLAYDLRVPFTDSRILRWSLPQRGDVVIFDNPQDGRLFVKRVVALPGDTVELRRNRLVVNGERATYTPLTDAEIDELPIDSPERYRFLHETLLGNTRVVMVRRGSPGGYDRMAPIQVPSGTYWMMGDNRDNSSDSRVIGAIDRDAIFGRAHAIAFSVDYERYYAPRLGRFFRDLP